MPRQPKQVVQAPRRKKPGAKQLKRGGTLPR
jgi:hypothetical protein